ncbi:MAG: hypothetical protein JWM80_1001 [Cyanobacteria bacterium RYN_339]|nr:hypothetical protein [Cyanobacteria bacterium RYN_339]
MRKFVPIIAASALLLGLAAPARALEVVEQAADEAFSLCVLDRETRQPLAGVRLRDSSAALVAMTDATGTASLPARCAEEAVLTLSRNGYPIVLLEGSNLSAHSLVVMRRFSAGVPAVRFRLL